MYLTPETHTSSFIAKIR